MTTKHRGAYRDRDTRYEHRDDARDKKSNLPSPAMPKMVFPNLMALTQKSGKTIAPVTLSFISYQRVCGSLLHISTLKVMLPSGIKHINRTTLSRIGTISVLWLKKSLELMISELPWMIYWTSGKLDQWMIIQCNSRICSSLLQCITHNMMTCSSLRSTSGDWRRKSEAQLNLKCLPLCIKLLLLQKFNKVCRTETRYDIRKLLLSKNNICLKDLIASRQLSPHHFGRIDNCVIIGKQIIFVFLVERSLSLDIWKFAPSVINHRHML